jgi:hypothetical protein
VVFPGSVYLLLSTNTGVRMGLLLAAAGFTGLIAVLSIMWLVLNSTAAIGRPNSWRPLEVVSGDFAAQNTIKGVQGLPVANLPALPPQPKPLKTQHWYWPLQSCPPNSGWYKLSTSQLTALESTADTVLAPTSAKGTVKVQLASPFTQATDYAYLDGFDLNANGGCLFSISRHKIYLPFGRGPHYQVIRAYPVVPGTAGTAKPTPDTSKPPVYVVVDRNLGSVHQPQAVVALSSTIVFLIICNSLHRRDKEIWARQEAERQAAAGGPGGGDREKVGAGV